LIELRSAAQPMDYGLTVAQWPNHLNGLLEFRAGSQ
jgi:hypothetical protein